MVYNYLKMPLVRKKTIFAVGLLVAVIIIGVALSFIDGGATKRTRVAIGGQTIYVEVADTTETQARGLSFRNSIGPNDGMLFVFDSPGNYGFWMKDMRFPIDIVWINNDKVVGFEENIDPQIGVQTEDLKIYYPPEPVNRVLEIRAGGVGSLGIRTGDRFQIQSFDRTQDLRP